ncbi:aldose epimerase family protein [Acetivibrio cellulolyticus]|uniref:aldose epimerase family protein n=1 Tax=Acetivibrio cellulolyticus TaxID=35830 RepID=UPI0001E2D0FB|nr:aldose epimerase family protein [Acetivibrio cellulolyticus]
MGILKEKFIDGYDYKDIDIFILSNSNGMVAKITNFGGIVISLIVPDRNGKYEDVVLGYDRLEDYFENRFYFGGIIGRHANRIENSKLEIKDIEYNLKNNEGRHHLHGGDKGFHKVIWDAETVIINNRECLQLTYLSRDGEENYPGNLKTTVTYSLGDDNSLRIDYFAVSDKDTVINLTNHSYFNLSWHGAGDITNHQLKIYSDKFTPINEEGIPTGEILEVTGTQLDFTSMKPVGTGLLSDDIHIKKGNGFDHNWVLKVSGTHPEKAAELYDPESGRFMEVYTTKPGIQFFSGNNLSSDKEAKDKIRYSKWGGLCLETQYFPNSLKHKHFPSPIFSAGKEYRHTTIYRFMTR